jgi:hypothetical protein
LRVKVATTRPSWFGVRHAGCTGSRVGRYVDAVPAPAASAEDFQRAKRSAAPPELSERRAAYLALGDSVAFGEDGFIPWTDPSRDRAIGFVGYPELLAFDPLLDGVVNLACPGETTGSFLSASAVDNGCREYKSLHPHGLHANYPGETQGEAALSFLAGRPDTRLVTLNLGGNDLLLVLAGCASEAYLAACATATLPGAIAQAAANLGCILGVIGGSGYAGRITYLTEYCASEGACVSRGPAKSCGGGWTPVGCAAAIARAVLLHAHRSSSLDVASNGRRGAPPACAGRDPRSGHRVDSWAVRL